MLQGVPDTYPIRVPDGSPVVRDLCRVDTSWRSPQLPCLYKYLGDHPYHRTKLPDSTTYVYLIDSSVDGKRVFDTISNAQTVPSGPISGEHSKSCYVVTRSRGT